jgi:hypothetical protein
MLFVHLLAFCGVQNLMSLAKAGGTVGTPHSAGGPEEKQLSGAGEEMDKKIIEYSPQVRTLSTFMLMGAMSQRPFIALRQIQKRLS